MGAHTTAGGSNGSRGLSPLPPHFNHWSFVEFSCSMIGLLLVSLVGCVVVGAVDLTLSEDATGSVVVDAVVDKITQACVLIRDSLILRRIAYAETKDGTAAGVNLARGGIWQVLLLSILDSLLVFIIIIIIIIVFFVMRKSVQETCINKLCGSPPQYAHRPAPPPCKNK